MLVDTDTSAAMLVCKALGLLRHLDARYWRCTDSAGARAS